jgi:sarcosine oxidase
VSEERRRIAVIGAGVMGSAAAWSLAGAGHQVTVLEQFPRGHERGSSHGPSRIFRLGYPAAEYVRMAREAAHLWRLLEDEAGTGILTVTGGVDLGPQDFLQRIAAAMAEAGQRYEWVEPAEAAERWPGLRFTDRALFHAPGGRLAAETAIGAFQGRAAGRGAQIRFDQRVEEIRVGEKSVELITAQGTVTAEVAVLAAGSWLPGLAARAALDGLPPMRVTQEQPAYFATGLDDSAWPVFVDYSPRDGVPRYGLHTPGAGVKVGEHGSGAEVHPDARPPVDEAIGGRLVAYARENLPGVDPAAVRVDTCLYTTTPDESFCLRRTGRLVVCSACSGHGFKFAPLIGRRVAKLAAAG